MFFTEETIETALNAGDYTLNLRYLTAFASGAQDSLQNPNCAVVELEIALAPIADLQTAAAQLQCPSHDVLPTKAVPPSPLTTGAFHYDSRVNESVPFMSIASYNYTLHPSYVDNVRFFYAIPLQLGDNGGALWGVELRVAFDFVSSGSIGAMLDFDTSTVPTNLRCMDRLVSYETCEIAQNTELNGRTLKWLLPPGNYSLYLYDFYAERMSSAAASTAALPQCAPFEMSLDIAPIMEPENAVTCPAQLFPTALDAVASVSQGYLRFNGDVFMDPVVRRHDVSFAVLEP